MKGQKAMYAKRRECKLVNKKYKNVDLTQFSKIIIDTINNTVPGKNPVVEKDKFSTDELTHKEAVKLGRALASLSELEGYGKTVTIFRLFDGKVVDTATKNNTTKRKHKGGRMK